jgi:hypothetical protein
MYDIDLNESLDFALENEIVRGILGKVSSGVTDIVVV